MLRRLSQWYRGIAPEVQKSLNMSSTIANPFPEEPLTLSGEEGGGFFPARLGMPLNSSRYTILRKLGRGQFSSTWLASDSL
jgi:serine/threonine-protein kinase SRPK3